MFRRLFSRRSEPYVVPSADGEDDAHQLLQASGWTGLKQRMQLGVSQAQQHTDAKSLIQRQLVLLRPKAPYARWVAANSKPPHPTLAQLRAQSLAYLIPWHQGQAQLAPAYVEKNFEFFFQRELRQWQVVRERWPQPCTRELFRQWFDVECRPLVMDVTMWGRKGPDPL